jgi:hypothetical protein
MKVAINPSQRIVIEFEGKEYPCKKATLGALVELEAAIGQAKANGSSVMLPVIAHLESCGLPKEMLFQLDSDQLEAVTQAVAPAKKN